MHEHGCVVYYVKCFGKSQGITSKVILILVDDLLEFFAIEVLFSHWIEDTMAVIDRLTVGPVILVGSGLGAWLSLLAAQAIAQREEEEMAAKSAPQTTFPSKLHGLGMYV